MLAHDVFYLSSDRTTRIVYDRGARTMSFIVENETVATATADDGFRIEGATGWNVGASRNPRSTDDADAGYAFSSIWFNATNGTTWFCTKADAGAASWICLNGFPARQSALYFSLFSGLSQAASVALDVTKAYFHPFRLVEAVDVSAIPVRVNTPDGVAVSGTANNGSGLIRLTVSSTSGMTTGDVRTVAGVGGTTAANGTWTITVINGTTIDLQGSTYAGTYTSGGLVSSVTSPGIKTAIYKAKALEGSNFGRAYGSALVTATGSIMTTNSGSDSLVDAPARLEPGDYWFGSHTNSTLLRCQTPSSLDYTIQAMIGRATMSGNANGVQGVTIDKAYSDSWPTLDGSTVWTESYGNGTPIGYLVS